MDHIVQDYPVTETPIVVNRSAVPAQTTSAVAAVVLVLTALPALVAVLGTRDVVQIVAYLGSNEFLPVAGLLATAATFLWRQVQVRRSHKEKVALADDALIGRVK